MRFHVLMESVSAWESCAGVQPLTSTCSDDHVSMLKDLTLEICVPSLRWMAAHRMHRKMPIYQGTVSRFESNGGSHENPYIPACPTCNRLLVSEVLNGGRGK